MLPFGRLEEYQGPLPLLPLQSIVSFPHTFLPLHIFEPRYRQMVKDAIEHDGLVGIVLLKPGWESHYYENPETYNIACMGVIARVEALPDGRYNILFHGIRRIKIEKTDKKKLYQVAKVKVIKEDLPVLHPRRENHLRREIFEGLSRILEPPFWGFSVLAAPHLDLGVLADFIAHSLPFNPLEKQRILEAAKSEARVDELVKMLEKEEGKGRRVRVRDLPFLHELARN